MVLPSYPMSSKTFHVQAKAWVLASKAVTRSCSPQQALTAVEHLASQAVLVQDLVLSGAGRKSPIPMASLMSTVAMAKDHGPIFAALDGPHFSELSLQEQCSFISSYAAIVQVRKYVPAYRHSSRCVALCMPVQLEMHLSFCRPSQVPGRLYLQHFIWPSH